MFYSSPQLTLPSESKLSSCSIVYVTLEGEKWTVAFKTSLNVIHSHNLCDEWVKIVSFKQNTQGAIELQLFEEKKWQK